MEPICTAKQLNDLACQYEEAAAAATRDGDHHRAQSFRKSAIRLRRGAAKRNPTPDTPEDVG